MKISIIIVNYNVEYFLEQCLNSVFSALDGIEGEVFVVDNNSVDTSVEMVKTKFPKVKLIANKDNVGFSIANNQALKISSGKYCLLLNPDTVVEEDTFSRIIEFMDAHPEAGGLGVKMIDGKGNFLPESKRGLPTPSVAFYKIFGLSTIFPKSKKFGRYHLGHLDNNEVHEIEILSGAFMLMRKSVLDKIGYLDEAFFMYGEDIDLSYRIIKAGYKNYYYPKSTIIHYKGESTKKSSVNYVFVFYNAMIIFAKKHFSQKNAKIFSFLINLAIYFRASLAIGTRIIKKAALPFFDFVLILCGLFLLKEIYEIYQPEHFIFSLVITAFPIYAIVWILSVYFNGGYDKPINLLRIIGGILIGSGIILIGYSLLPENLRFSRLMIVGGTIWTLFTYLTSRAIFHATKFKDFRIGTDISRKFAIVGNSNELERIENILTQTKIQPSFVAKVSPGYEEKPKEYHGNLNQLEEIVEIYNLDEIIFCAKDISSHRIIEEMAKPSLSSVEFKIAQPESLYLIGSNSIETSGDLYAVEINSILKEKNIRNKKLFDISFSLLSLAFFWITLWFVESKGQFIKNIFSVLIGKKSWVGYHEDNPKNVQGLPKIKPGVVSVVDSMKIPNLPSDTIKKLNLVYARNYSALGDLKTVLKSFKKLGSK